MMQNLARRKGFTLIELLVVIAIISIIAGFLVPTLLRGRGEAYKLQCANNLKQIYTPAMSYSDKKGGRKFPCAPGRNPRAHESLNLMLEYDQEGLTPELFTCPEGEATPAQVDDEQKFLLDETSCAYSWAGRPVKNTTRAHLSSDKYIDGYEDELGMHLGHKGGMNVLWTDNSIKFVDEVDLPEDTLLPQGLVR